MNVMCYFYLRNTVVSLMIGHILDPDNTGDLACDRVEGTNIE